jgi:hypothetical protein
MSEDQLQQIVGKASKLNELRRAKDRVRQLERELRGEPVKPKEPDYVPEFLRARVAGGLVSSVPARRRVSHELTVTLATARSRRA